MTEPLSAFGELLAVTPNPVAGWSFAYNINTELITSTVADGGTATSSVGRARLQTSTDAAGVAKIETSRALRYTPGQGGLGRFTAVFTTGVADSQQIIGIGDAVDGFFFGFNGVSFGIMSRNNSVDTWVPVESWNEYDKADDFFVLDYTKGNIFQIRYQWLGYGAIRFYIENPRTGVFQEVHHIDYAGTSVQTSIRNPTLPLMAEAANLGNTTNIEMLTPSGMLFTEGPSDVALHPLTLWRPFEATVAGITTEVPLLTVLAASTYKTIASRVHSQLAILRGTSDGTKGVLFKVYKGVTLTGSPSFTDYDADSSTLSFDIAASGFTGGTFLTSFTLAKEDSDEKDMLSRGIQIAPGEQITITATSASSTDVIVGMDFLERF